jgi:2Fe-2S ferredoxin
MTKIIYVEFSGNERVLDIAPGTSVMQGAVTNGVRGIIGDCGGACSCATCHVYVDSQWVDKVGDKTAAEISLLEEVCDVEANSRLSCQIKITDALEGLVVRVPAKQV